MKAVVYSEYGPPGIIRIEEFDKPSPKNNEVLIKVDYSTVSTVDSIFRSGEQFFARMATGLTKPKKTILGFEFSGQVESVGKQVTKFNVGDEVFGAFEGTHCEYICVPGNDVIVQTPSNLNLQESAAVPAGALTALPFLRDTGKIKKGQKIVIIGASGSVGTYAVQLAKYFGAEVTGVCSTKNVELVKSLGTDFVIDYTKEDFTKNNKTYDIIFDTVGKSSYAICKNSLVKNGTFLTTVISGRILFQMLITTKFSSKKAKITFTGMRSAEDKLKDLHFIKNLIESEKLKVIIDRIYSIDQIAEAYSHVDKGHKRGNVVINFTE